MSWRNVQGVLIVLATVLATGYLFATCDVPPEPRVLMERALGSDAVCGDLRDDTAKCILGV